MALWDLASLDWDRISTAEDQVSKALVAVRRQFVGVWNEAHQKALEASFERTKKRVAEAENAGLREELVGLDQSSWDAWLNEICALVRKTYRDVFKIALNSESKLSLLPPPHLAVECSIFFTKSSLAEREGHPFGDFFSAFVAGHKEDGGTHTFAGLREEFKRSITAQVVDLYDESVIELARQGWKPPAPETGSKGEPASVPPPIVPELPKLEDLRTLGSRDSRTQTMIQSIFKPLAAEIGRARDFKLSGKVLSAELKKTFLALCRQEPRLYPILSQASEEEIESFIFGSKRHYKIYDAALEIIENRCKTVKLSVLKRYTRVMKKNQKSRR